MRIVISGGGTGGHIYPALAIADEIIRRQPDAEIMYIGSQGSMEAEIVPRAGYCFAGVRISGMSRSSRWKALQALAIVPGAIREALRMLQSFQPDLVLGTGGYASFPVMLAAVWLKKKTFIHEQNALPGLSNRRLASRVDWVFLTFSEALDYMRPAHYKTTGFPVRREIGSIDAQTARSNLNLNENRFTLLVFGGSQGAHSINQAVLDFLEMRGEETDIQIYWACGTEHIEELKEAFKMRLTLAAQAQVCLQDYIHDMPSALAAADLALCRAGAGTISELALAGLPAILVPYPYAAEDHQQKNARSIELNGAAVVVSDHELNAGSLSKLMAELRAKPELLESMARKMKSLARPNALDEIVNTMFNALAD